LDDYRRLHRVRSVGGEAYNSFTIAMLHVMLARRRRRWHELDDTMGNRGRCRRSYRRSNYHYSHSANVCRLSQETAVSGHTASIAAVYWLHFTYSSDIFACCDETGEHVVQLFYLPGNLIVDTTRILCKEEIRVYETVKRPSVRLSVCLSHRSIASAACGGFAAKCPAGRRYRSIADDGAQQQTKAVLTAEWQGRAQTCFSCLTQNIWANSDTTLL